MILENFDVQNTKDALLYMKCILPWSLILCGIYLEHHSKRFIKSK